MRIGDLVEWFMVFVLTVIAGLAFGYLAALAASFFGVF